MSVYKSLVLGGLFALVALYIYMVELPGQQRKIKQELVLGGVSAGELSEITVKNTHGTFSLVRQDGSDDLSAWSLAGLEKAKLEKGALNALLTALLDFRPDPDIKPIRENLDGPVFGLQEPEVHFQIVKSDGREVTIGLGNKNEYLQKRYARVSNNEFIFLAGEDLYQAGTRSKQDLRDKAPVGFSNAEIKSFSIKSGAEIPLVFTVDDSHAWYVTKDETSTSYKASDSEVSSLLKEFRRLRADEFIDDLADNKGKYNLEDPAVVVTLNFKDVLQREPIQIVFSQANKQSDDVVFTTSQYPFGYRMNKNPLPLLSRSMTDFREKQFFSFASDLAIKAVFSGRRISDITLQQEEEGWTVNGQKGDFLFIRQLLENYSNLEAVDFIKENYTFDFDDPLIRAAITIQEGVSEIKEMTLLIGGQVDPADDEKGFYARLESEPDVYIISKASYRRLVPRKEALVELEEDGSVPDMKEFDDMEADHGHSH